MVNVYNGERVQKLNTQCCPCSAKRHSLHAEKQNILFQEYLESKVCGTKGFKNTAANMWWMSCWGMNRCQVWNRKASPFLAPLTRWMGQAYNEISLERTLLVSWAVTCELTNSDVKGNRMRQEGKREAQGLCSLVRGMMEALVTSSAHGNQSWQMSDWR